MARKRVSSSLNENRLVIPNERTLIDREIEVDGGADVYVGDFSAACFGGLRMPLLVGTCALVVPQVIKVWMT